jgi:hypothetical protein
MTGVSPSVRRVVIVMWIATAFTLGLNIYAALVGNLVLIGVGLGVTLSYSIAGIFLGIFSARSQSKENSHRIRE